MNPFDYLGIAPVDGLKEAKAAYRRLAKACHPDQHPDDPDAAAKFAILSEAYAAVLSAIEKRPSSSGGPSEAVVGRGHPIRTRTVWREVEIDVGQAASGCEVVVPGASGACAHCAGDGRVPLGHETECSTCSGSGVSGTRYGGYVAVSIQCQECEGTGRTTYVPCHACGGFGISSTSECRVVLPANVRDGDAFLVEGAASIPSENVRGDVQVAVKIVDRRYRLVGDDVETTVWLDIWEASAGGSAAVRLHDGETVRMRYPAGTAAGRRFVMSGRGLPRLGAEGRGDFVAVTAVRPVDPGAPEVSAALEALRVAVMKDRAARRGRT